MGYFIRNKQTNLYYYHKEHYSKKWIADINEAYQWKTREAVENAIKFGTIGKVDSKNLEIGSIDEVTILEDTETHIVAITANQEVEVGLTPEQIENYITTLYNLSNATDAFSHIPLLIGHYLGELSKYDRMQEDILHKIEFDEIHGVVAVRLVKQLKKIRLKRREVKNKINFLNMLKVQGTPSLGSKIDSFFKNLETRTYTPRELPELFNN